MTASPPSQLPVTDRLPALDILRGVALLGILIMNVPNFSQSLFAEADGSHLWPGRLDQTAEQVRKALFSGKFNSMFSLLFGIGFTIQYQRLRQQDAVNADAVYLRRLLVLGALGLVHAFVFWTGDVLHVYAALGLLLLFPLQRVSDRGIIALIIACLVYPALSGMLRVILISPQITAERLRTSKAFEASNNAVFGHGTVLDMAIENARMMTYWYTDPVSLWAMFGWYVMFALTMLIGLLAGRRRWVQRIPELMPQIRRLTWPALALGLACAATFTVINELYRTPGPSPIKVLGSICYSLSRVSMMIFYVLVIVRASQHAAWQRRFAPFAAAGRMPLANYLMQTAICITLFNGWGFGLWLHVGPAAGLALSLAIFFGVQVPWSLWWLRRHERGPLETVWARLTYGRRLAMPGPARASKPGHPPGES